MDTETYWKIQVGEQKSRKDIRTKYGGRPRQGISNLSRYPNEVLIFSNPHSQDYEKYGGFQEDGTFLYYAGDRQSDGTVTPNVKTLDQAKAAGKNIRFFRTVEAGEHPTYLGRAKVGDIIWREIADDNGVVETRGLIELIMQDEVTVRNIKREWSEPRLEGSKTAAAVTSDDPEDRSIAYEENALHEAFADWTYRERREQPARLTIHVGVEILRPDIYLESSNWIIEAKKSASRGHVRHAIGQVLDYCHLAKQDEDNPISARPAILLPKRPTPDLVSLVKSLDIILIVQQETSNAFEVIEP